MQILLKKMYLNKLNKEIEKLVRAIGGALRDLVPFVQFKKRENIHGGVLILVKFQASVFRLKLTPLHECFSLF